MYLGPYTGHVYKKCARPAPCGGCQYDGMDCRYECLSVCEICGGLEGALLPVCPGKQLTMEEHDANYKHYCEGTGPFAGYLFSDKTEAS